MSNDELRARTETLKNKIQEFIASENEQIAELKAGVEDTDLNLREDIYKEIDKLEKDVTEKIEKVLSEILPEAFAIINDTARRFTENEETIVFDRDLATKHDFVTIRGNDAVYKNEWTAGGNLIKWEMVHYDVQLFGGVVLHKGKIAEMATGEGKTLVATLPVFLNALAHRGVHVVTVYVYLSILDSFSL